MTDPALNEAVLPRTGFFVLHRVSTRQQGEKFGLSWQHTNLPPYGEKWLGPCLGDYDEGVASTSLPLAKRPTMLDLLSDAEEIRPGYLLVCDQDRLSREDDFWFIKGELRRAGVKLAYYREGAAPEILDLDDEYGDFMSDVFASVGKLEKRRITKRMRRGKQEAASQGNVVMPVTYGYYKPEKNKVAICPERGPVAQVILRKVAGGASIRTIVRWLNQSNIPSPRGKIGGWTISGVSRMVRNPAYIGKAQMLGKTVAFPPLIDEETFSRIPEALKRNQTFSKRNNTRFDYLVRGLVRCARCGRAMCGKPRHDKPVYRCNGQVHDKSRGVGCVCDQPIVMASIVDDLVWRAVSEFVVNPDLIRSHVAATPTVIAAEATFLRRKLQRFDDRRQAILRQHEMGAIADEELTGRLAEIALERKEDEMTLAEIEGAADRPEVDLSRLEEAEHLCRDLVPRLAEASFEEKRALVEKLVSRVVVDGKHVTVELIAPLVPAAT